ncbi:carbohydrate ABC transporter permease [Solirhodobacter olei]|uniref:carbohydrate ABC transporter permease n=1 Tax=Solirhodobacter olei TaxID=2493082 RepID=UPI000FDCBE70|nr:sugar ABC transporter permease [Solirhodobacter olei]
MKREWIYAYLMLLPALVVLATFMHVPTVETFIASFWSTARGMRPSHFVGLKNYHRMIADPTFWQAMHNNLIYAIITVPLSMGLALVMALLVQGRLKGTGFMRMAFFTPTVLPLIAVANIWIFFYTPGFGLIDQIRGLFGLPASNLLGTGSTALYAVSAVAVWKQAGFFMIFYLAALQTIPVSLIEAAQLEGASRWQIFRRITLPLIMPTTLFISVNAVIDAVRLVDQIFQMTQGGPNNATAILFYYIYQVGFQFWDTAYAATLTVVMIVILSVLALGQVLFLDRRIHYK